MANAKVTLRANAALASSENGADQDNAFYTGVILTVVTTNKASSASLTAKLQYKTNLGAYVDVTGAVTAAITTNTTTTLVVAPTVAAAANAAVSFPLPRTWRVVLTISGGTFDVSVTADLLK
jgi:hypothetical protein